MTARTLSLTGLPAAIIATVAICLAVNFTARSSAQAPASIRAKAMPASASYSESPQLASPQRVGPNAFLGSWNHEAGLYKLQFTISQNTIDGKLNLPLDDTPVEVEFHGEYSLSEGGLLFGVIHHAELKMNGLDGGMEEAMQIKLMATRLTEQPFALRVRAHGSALIVKDIKLGVSSAFLGGEELERFTNLFIGRYARSESTPYQAPTISSSTY